MNHLHPFVNHLVVILCLSCYAALFSLWLPCITSTRSPILHMPAQQQDPPRRGRTINLDQEEGTGSDISPNDVDYNLVIIIDDSLQHLFS